MPNDPRTDDHKAHSGDGVASYNSQAWDAQVAAENKWTVPVQPNVVAAARRGEFGLLLTPSRPVPLDWFPSLAGADVLCLASGGGQQTILLAAAGASVTVVDLSPAQLKQDTSTAEREGLTVKTIEADMRDLSPVPDESFDLIVHPCSNCFVEDILPVWREAFRVLRPGGVLMAGFSNPLQFLFDDAKREQGELIVRHKIPYSDVRDLSPEEIRHFTDRDLPLMFGHTLDDQIGGQLAAGFVIDRFFEDRNPPAENDPLSRLIDAFIATRARKPA